MSSRGPEQDLNHIDHYRTPTGQVRWRVRLRLSGGRRLSRSFPALVDAQNWRDQQLISRRHERRQPPPSALAEVLGYGPAVVVSSNGNGVAASGVRALASLPVADFIRDHYWPQRAQKRLAPRTLGNYWRAYERFIEPSPMGQLAVAAIDAEDVLDWQEWCEVEAGATTEMIRTAQKVLSGAYTWGAARPKRTGIWLHPVALAEWPETERSLVPYIADPLTVERVRQAILGGRGRPWTRQRDALLLSLMALTGARIRNLPAPAPTTCVVIPSRRFSSRRLCHYLSSRGSWAIR